MKMKAFFSKLKDIRLNRWQRILLIIVLAGIVISAPYIIEDNYVLHILILCGIYVCLTLSLNLIIGWSGQFSLGHVCFYGMGAYITTLLITQQNMGFFQATLLSTLLTSIFAMLLCLPTLKLRGDYLAVITLGFGEVFRLFLTNAVDLTKGPAGIPNIPDPVLFGFEISSKQAYFYFIAIVVAVFLFFMKRFNNSGFGMAMMVVNEDDIAATALGINVVKYKLWGFVIGGGMAAMIGSFYAVYMGMISPTSFAYAESIKMVSMVVLGGMGSIPGSVLGAVLLTALPEVLRSFSEYRMVVYGALMVIMMIFRPEGIWARSNRMLNEYKIRAFESVKK
ncbi:MAG: branched-chain amino acid ABC transporter permease [Lachnospiraceae bacterium]|nr:branched-chain amino acid ABC transporter permease [Lachnospiraceae bacterium]